MNCEQVQELLSPYIDNMLETDAETAVARHLEMCGECSREYSQLVQLISMLKAMGDEELPEGFNDRLRSRLRSAGRKRIWLPTWLPAGAAAAILVLLFLGAAPAVFQDDTLLMEGERAAQMNTALESKQVPSSRSEKKEPVLSFGFADEQSASPDEQPKSGTDNGGTDNVGEKSMEPSTGVPQISNRSNTGIRSRDEGYTAETFPGGTTDKLSTKKSELQQPLPEADSQMDITTFSLRAARTTGPVLHLRVEDIDSVSVKLKAVAKSIGGTVRETGGENGVSQVSGSFQVSVPRQRLEQFMRIVSGFGEVVQDSVPRQSSDSTAQDLAELKKKREDLNNQILNTAHVSEVKALQQEIAQLDMEIEALESASEARENELEEINILLEEKGK